MHIPNRQGLWLEGIQLKPEANNKLNFLPIRFFFINAYTYPNPKPTPYNNAKVSFCLCSGHSILVNFSETSRHSFKSGCPVESTFRDL